MSTELNLYDQVAEAVDDPWGHPVSGDIVRGLCKLIETREARIKENADHALALKDAALMRCLAVGGETWAEADGSVGSTRQALEVRR
jgi:hypothetical protein